MCSAKAKVKASSKKIANRACLTHTPIQSIALRPNRPKGEMLGFASSPRPTCQTWNQGRPWPTRLYNYPKLTKRPRSITSIITSLWVTWILLSNFLASSLFHFSTKHQSVYGKTPHQWVDFLFCRSCSSLFQNNSLLVSHDGQVHLLSRFWHPLWF